MRQTLTAYALNVRKLMGDADPARARSLIQEAGLEKLPLEAVGWLLPVLSDDPGSKTEVEAIRRLLLNRVTETAGTAHFATSYGDNGYLLLHSDRRADGIILEALIGDQPESDLIPKIVRGLLAHRTAGRWTNTQENVFILLALDRYFNTYEAQTPDFVARIWLGEQYAGEAAFRGRTTDYQQIDVPMSVVAAQPGAQDLILSKEGPGRLYYRLGLRYAPTDLKLPPYDAGFTVERTLRGRGRSRRRAARRGRRLAHQGRRARPGEADDGRADPALSRGAGRSAAGRARGAEPGAGAHRQPAEEMTGQGHNPPPTGGGGAPGTSTRTCAMSGSRRSRRCCGTACALRLHRPRHHARHLRRPADQGRRNVRAGDVRPRGRRSSDRGVKHDA